MSDQVLTVEEAADRLDKPVSTVRRWAKSGRLPGTKVGRQWLIDASALPRPRASVRRATPAAVAVDLDVALDQLSRRDLRALWVPDVLMYEDMLAERVYLKASAATKLSEPGPFDPVTIIDVPKSPFATRPGADLSIEDRLAYHAAVASCSPRIERLLSDSVYSARRADDPKYLHLNGRDQWLAWRTEAIRLIEKEGYEWMVHTDVTSYFDSIEHQLLFADIDRVCPNREVASALKRMVGDWAMVSGRGIPQGPDVSRALGNLYLIPIDEQMVTGGWKYLRFMDDIILLGRSRRTVVEAVHALEVECRRRGLVLSGHKSHMLIGKEAVTSLTEPELDNAQYWLDVGAQPIARNELRRILRQSLAKAGALNARHALFSLYRLHKLRDHFITRTVLDNIEQLAPVSSAMAQYLYPFLSRRRVEDGLIEYFQDRERNTSAFASAWLLAGCLDRGDRVPAGIVAYTANVCRDASQPTFHRVIAANVVALGRRPSDIAWLTSSATSEFDPTLVRGYVVALGRVSRLPKNVERMVTGRNPRLALTFKYLRGRSDLPSLVFPDRRAPVLT